MTSTRQNILITGGAGFIGSHLAEVLLQAGHQVTVVDDLSTGSYGNVEHLEKHRLFRVYVETVQDFRLMDRLMRDHDTVYHLASAVGVRLIMDHPVFTIDNIYRSTEIVLRLARRYRTRVLITSSSEVYGKSDKIPFEEDGDRLAGPTSKHRWAYACAKALDEFLALAHWRETRLSVIVARLFNTVGPRQQGQYGMVFPRFVASALKGKDLEVYGDGNQTRCFCHVQDVVAALIGLMDAGHCFGQIFNVGSTEEISILQLANRVISLLDSPSQVRKVPYIEAFGDGFEDMQRRIPCINKIGRAIGWEPKTDLDATIKNVASILSTSDLNTQQ